MKNLKKVLSLALAFAMVLGLCVGAMAAQDVTKAGDWADVTNKDAAQLLNAFNIMAGDDKGNFNPANNVTRAEATKMIAVALWSGEDLKDWFKDSTTTFTDVHSADWFAGYVNYAVTTGIVGGRNATTFDPKGNVTGYELLKMTLTALGYKQDVEGLIGANWKVNTMRLAIGGNDLADLTKDVKVTSWDTPISRDNTAKVVANMIGRATVKYDRDGYLVVNTKTENDETVNVTFGAQYLGVTTKTGVLVANTYGTMNSSVLGATTGAAVYKVKDADHFNAVVQPMKDGKIDGDPIDVNSDSGLFALGSNATVYLSNGVAISTVVTPAAAINDPYAKFDTDTNGDKAVKTITVGPATGDTAYNASFNFDTNANGKYDLTITVKFATIKEVKDVVETKNFGTVYQTEGVAWRDLYDKEGEKLRSGFTTLKTIAGDAPAKGDQIMYSTVKNASDKDVTIGVALDATEGKVTRINGSTYYIDGVAHSIGTKTSGTTSDAACVTLTFGTAATFYTYPGSTEIVLTGDVKTEAVKVALIYDAGYTPGTEGTGLDATTTKPVVEVAAILPDGTPGTYVLVSAPKDTSTNYDLTTEAGIADAFGNSGALTDLNSKAWTVKTTPEATTIEAGNDAKNYIVEYTLTDDGYMKITKIEKLDDTNVIKGGEKGTAITTSTTSVKVGDDSKVITPDTVTFIQTSIKKDTDTTEKWTAYVGRTASYTIKAGNNNEDGAVQVVLTDYTSEKDAAAVKYALVEYKDCDQNVGTKSDFYYVIAVNGQIGDSKYEYVVYDASADEVKTITTEDDKVSGTAIAKGDFYTTYDGKKFSEKQNSAWVVAANTGYVTSFKDNILVITGYSDKANTTDKKYPFDQVKTIAVDNDTKYYFLGDDKTSAKITAADVVAQAPSKEPTLDTTKDPNVLTTPYQAIVIASTTKTGYASTVIVFEAEQSYTTNVTTSGR